MGEQRKAGSGDCSVILSISSPWRFSWKEGGWREEREAASRRTITAGGSEEEEMCKTAWTAAYTSTIVAIVTHVQQTVTHLG